MTILKKLLPKFIKNILKRLCAFLNWDEWINYSYSQEGEDMILQRIFENKKNGFYIDVGAHHPKRFSNTYLFYKKSWTGINIDAMPGSMKLFKKFRPKDLNLEFGVAEKEGFLDYYMFNEPALNSFSKPLSNERNNPLSSYFIEKIIKVEVKPLYKILDTFSANQKIDFLNIDVEGYDLKVLKSNDWVKYRPKIVLVEIVKSSLHDLNKDLIVEFMKKKKYDIFAKQVNTVFFKDTNVS